MKEEISDRLMQDGDIDASNISIQVKDGEVTLEGTLTDRQSKRQVEDVCEEIMGLKDVSNRLKVQTQQAGAKGSKFEGEEGKEGESNQHGSQKTGKAPKQ